MEYQCDDIIVQFGSFYIFEVVNHYFSEFNHSRMNDLMYTFLN